MINRRNSSFLYDIHMISDVNVSALPSAVGMAFWKRWARKAATREGWRAKYRSTVTTEHETPLLQSPNLQQVATCRCSG